VREQSTKLCECGCGEPAPLASQTMKSRGWVKGEPIRFIHGHHPRGKTRWFWGDHLYTVTDCGHPTPCWIWNGCHDHAGYGSSRRGKPHRVSWVLTNGPVPDGLELDHLCRQRSCCNPDHLEAVTHLENVRRGAGPKLTPEQRDQIAVDPTSPQSLIAERYGVSLTRVEQIKREWRHAHPQG
jgi:hypothetical protein